MTHTPTSACRIIARRSNGETVYFCSSDSQGERFVPNARSYACLFDTNAQAMRKLNELQLKWRGLNLGIESDFLTSGLEEKNHDYAMEQAFGTHGQG